MSKLKYAWWPYIRNVIRWHRSRMRKQKLTKRELQEMEAVKAAIRSTAEVEYGQDRLELIRKVFWQNGRVTLQRAAADLFISYATARRWQHDFFLAVAKELGLYDPEEDA